MKLVPDWHDAWKWHSTWVIAVLSALPFVWAELPHDLKTMVPDEWGPFIAAVMFGVGVFLRVRAQ